MLDISSIVYTRLKNDDRLKKYLAGSGTTKNDTPSAFPYMYVNVLGQPTSSRSLQNKQCAALVSIEITIYDSGSSTKAKQLAFLAADIMTELGFGMNYGPAEINRAGANEAYRWLARFSRTYCEGDLI